MKWRNIAWIGIGILAALAAWTAHASDPAGESGTDAAANCVVPATYQEAVDEHHHSLLRLSILTQSGSERVQDSRNMGSYLSLLMSMRHYHEEKRHTLPDCAQPLNQAYTETISATQDIFSLLLALEANPDFERSYQMRLRRAVETLHERWQQLLDAAAGTPLAAQEA